MTPAARVKAAMDCLDAILSGDAAERVLTTWGRQNRYAGSKDRAAVRDHVYGALRRRRSAAWVGGADTGRAVMIGALVMEGADLAALCDGSRHGPAPRSAGEGEGDRARAPRGVRLDLPDWIVGRLDADLGPEATDAIGAALRDRAPLFLRVNALRGGVAEAVAALAGEGIATAPVPGVPGALRVTDGAARVAASAAYATGLVEVQDASSQAAVLATAPRPGARVLDYCAGGGGKALALAALTGRAVMVHDIDPARMSDIPARAARAGADLRVIAPQDMGGAGSFDLVFVDAPCSGSGTWRRTPDAKWRLTPARLDDLCSLQARVLSAAAEHVAPGGRLAWATCSVLACENAGQVARLVAAGGWRPAGGLSRLPGPEGDGFGLAIIEKA